MDGASVRWLDEAEQRAWRAWLRGGRLVMEALDRDMARHGLSLSEYEVLSMLSETPEVRMRMSELAHILVQSRSRLTHTANRLTERGWVTRQACPDDRRGVLLGLTEQGRAKVAAIAPVHVASVRAVVVDQLSAEQLACLGEAMEILRRNLAPVAS